MRSRLQSCCQYAPTDLKQTILLIKKATKDSYVCSDIQNHTSLLQVLQLHHVAYSRNIKLDLVLSANETSFAIVGHLQRNTISGTEVNNQATGLM